ncbi:hypothetical protein DQ04_00961010 [Trypanosoma grayi]|uniref:hypothetical protein n=1 Tax=Trypanosoma grayi TaxID=71804 RepID=UPI0004F421B1|nr:hypothetical protein DQ04_00961010 [Trypanosoma grayi]KEG13508.1 hypothetical protein DQ04_00961010 [Trypanosoma grayi]
MATQQGTSATIFPTYNEVMRRCFIRRSAALFSAYWLLKKTCGGRGGPACLFNPKTHFKLSTQHPLTPPLLLGRTPAVWWLQWIHRTFCGNQMPGDVADPVAALSATEHQVHFQQSVQTCARRHHHSTVYGA